MKNATLSTLFCWRISASKRLASASVWPKLAPSGSHSSTISSGRLESGKNCFSTYLKPNTPSTKAASVMTITVLRYSTHQFTQPRKRL